MSTLVSKSTPAPTLSLLTIVRLGLFQSCLGCLAVVFAGMFNGVMLDELALPGLLVGGSLAFEQFVAPARVLFGQVSDAHPLAGRRRVPYVLIGTALFCGLAVLSVPLIFQVHRLWTTGVQPALALAIAALCGLFALYGLAIAMATTPYLALVIDRTSEAGRPRAIGIIWCMLTVGIVIGAIAISISLRQLDGIDDPVLLEPALFKFMTLVALAVFSLTVLATWGIEPALVRSSMGQAGQAREDAVTLGQAWRLITSSGQVLIFFSFLVLFTLGLFLQDPILEGYGGQVFGMTIAARSQLNAFWGGGSLVGLLVAGLWIVPWLGKLPTARLGCRLIVLTLLLLLLSGLTAQPVVLKIVMLFFGLATGIATNSALCLMLDLTLPEAAGTFVGVWGLAQALARALGKVIGGGLMDLGRLLPFGGAYPPYALVLSIEILVAASALLLLARLNVRQFKEDTERSLERALALELG